MTKEPNDTSSREEQLNQIIAEYLQAVESGQSPDKETFIARHPDFATDLAEFFADKERFDGVAEQLRPPETAPTLPNEPETQAYIPDEPTRIVDSDENDVPPPGTTIRYFGDYELLEEIARGGMGVVYKARQTSLNRIVALKMILAWQLASEEDVKRFRTEAEAAANLQHPNIVAIHEVGEHEGQHYFSMDYVEGGSLAEIVRENPLPARKAAEYVKTIAEAIHYAHEQGTLHRDLKPSNVLIDANDGPHITDFGLAKRIEGESELTASGAVLGTPGYMPPEQAAGKRGEVGPASDVYSLGAILYELLTGRPPFRAETPLDTIMQVLESEPAPPRVLNPNVPKDLDTICLKCLDKEQRRRYGSARELSADMDRFLNGEAIRARPIRAYERMMKWAKRRPAIAAMTVGIILVAILGFAGITWQWRAAVEAREQARTERDKALLAEARATKERDAAEDARSRETAARRQATAARRKAELSRERSQVALCRSLYEQARALRLLGQSGRRWRVLDLIKQAEALRARKRGVPAEPGGGAELLTQHELRGEALAALLLRDGRVVEQSAGLTHGVSPHGRFALAVWIDPGRQTGGVRLVDLVANKELMNLEGEKRVKAIGAPIAMALGPDGKRLASVTMDFCGVVIAELPSGKRLRELKLPAALAQSTPKSIFRKAFEAGKRAYERGKKHSPRESAALKAPPAVEARAGKPVPPSAKTAPGQTPRSLTQVGKEPGPAPKLSSKSETIKLTQGPVTVESNAPRSRLRYIAFGPNGRYLVGALFPPNIVIWNLESKDPEGRLLPGKNFPLASFSPDGRLLAYAGDDNKVILWNLAANRIEKEIQTDWRPGGPVAFFPNNKHLAIYCIKDDSQTGPTWEGAIIRWDIEAGRAVDRIETRTGVSTSPLAVSADGRRIALADANGMVHVLLLTASREPQWLALQHGAMVQQLVWQPNGRLVSSGLGSLKIWEFAQEPPMRTLPLSPQAAGRKGRFALSPDGRWVAMEKAGGRDVWLFDRETGALLQTIHHAARGPFLAYQLGFSPDARVLVRLGYGGMIAWDVPGGQQHARLATDLRKGESAWSVGFAADSKFLVGGILGRQPAVRDAETKDTLWKGGNAPGHVAILSRDGRLFAVYPSFFMGKKATISVRELPGGNERFHVEHPRRFGLQMLARFSPRSRWLAGFELVGLGPAGPSNMPSGAMAMVPLDMRGKNEWTATIWDVATGDKHLELRGPSSVEEFEFSADDRYLALALRDGTVQLWDVEGKRHLFDWQAWPNEAGTGAPQQGRRYLAFTPDSSSLAVLDPKGNRLRFLDLKRLRQQLDPIGLAW